MSVARTNKRRKLPSAAVPPILPGDLVRRILDYAPLEALLDFRPASRSMSRIVARDSRWLPIVRPPSLAAAPALSLDEHGESLIRLYVRYRRWLLKWEQHRKNGAEGILRTRYTTALDGFFALAPWDRLGADALDRGEILAWLEPMVYRREEQLDASATAGRRRSRRIKPAPPETRPSHFYHQRERDDDDAFRTFYSVPVGLSEAFECREPHRRHYVLQPLNIRDLSGDRDGRIPDLSDEPLEALNLARALLSCYLLDDDGCTIIVPEVETLACNTELHVQRDAMRQRYITTNENGTVVNRRVFQLHLSAFQEEPELPPICEEDDAFTTYIVAPHIRPMDQNGGPSENLAWCFSSPADVSDDDPASPWVISTHQPELHMDSPALLARHIAGDILYCALGNGAGLDLCCESRPCALNNSDSVGESASRSLLLCPCCLRKLQWMGLLGDVPACLGRLRDVLGAPGIRHVNQRDLDMLEEWGHV